MSVSSRLIIAALAIGALAACVRNPESVRPEVQPTMVSSEPQTVVPSEYYGRTEFEIPGGDGQVIDYTFG